jgi:hypothetical protein
MVPNSWVNSSFPFLKLEKFIQTEPKKHLSAGQALILSNPCWSYQLANKNNSLLLRFQFSFHFPIVGVAYQ